MTKATETFGYQLTAALKKRSRTDGQTRYEAVQALLESQGPNCLKDFTYERNLPLCQAIHSRCSQKTIQLMMDYGADPHQEHPNTFGQTPYELAVSKKRTNILELFGDSQVTQTFGYQLTAAIRQSQGQTRYETIKALLETQGPNCLKDFTYEKNLPLWHAINSRCSIDTIQLMMNYGADPHQEHPNTFGQTPYELAVSKKRTNILELFGDSQVTQTFGYQLTAAIRQSQGQTRYETIKALLETQGPNCLKDFTYEKNLPLWHAIHSQCSQKTIQLMMDYGADPHQENPNRIAGTPYELAVSRKRTNIIELFAEPPAPPSVPEKHVAKQKQPSPSPSEPADSSPLAQYDRPRQQTYTPSKGTQKSQQAIDRLVKDLSTGLQQKQSVSDLCQVVSRCPDIDPNLSRSEIQAIVSEMKTIVSNYQQKTSSLQDAGGFKRALDSVKQGMLKLFGHGREQMVRKALKKHHKNLSALFETQAPQARLKDR